MRLVLLAGAGMILAIVSGGMGYFTGYSKVRREPGDRLACRASLDITTRLLHFSGTMKLYLADGHGVLLINGHYQRQHLQEGLLNRKVLFTYTRHGEMLYMTSQRVDIAVPDNAGNSELALFLPGFFFTPKVKYNTGLYQQGDGYIFSGATLPFAYCLNGIS